MVAESTEDLAELFAKACAERDDWKAVATYLIGISGGTAFVPSSAFGSAGNRTSGPSATEEPCALGDIRKFVVKGL